MANINETAKTLGVALRQARISAYIPREDIARMLRITPNELTRYETAQAEIPISILQCLLASGYTMLNARNIQKKYMEHARRLRELNALEF